jgi:hypothetical protein
MKNLFAPSDRQQILERLDRLQEGATRQWGKMEPAQMCAHCVVALEVGTGDLVRDHSFIGKVLGRFVKGSLLGEKPFSKNSPTDLLSSSAVPATSRRRRRGSSRS